ncbi:MAG: glutathione S-transferase N-terminal domain-containing protein [Nanoarchaeota archaeon]|nr:glutathione S-transferase N-terminal domain-containing protein [Nanoarchaeota archaeon]
MTKITLFANEACPYCQKVIAALKAHNKEYEFVEIPMDRSQRPATEHNGKTYADLFNDNVSIPKMIIENGEQKKFFDSQDMIDHLENE